MKPANAIVADKLKNIKEGVFPGFGDWPLPEGSEVPSHVQLVLNLKRNSSGGDTNPRVGMVMLILIGESMDHPDA